MDPQSRTRILVSIKERYRLNHPSSQKETYHLTLDLKGAGVSYSVGDCIGVYPKNHPDYVRKLIFALKATGNEIVKEGIPLETFLSDHANLSRTTKGLLSLFNEEEKLPLLALIERHQNRLPTLTQFCEQLAPQLPRLYSIASSMHGVGDEAHLVVGLTQFDDGEGNLQFGTCSYYLSKLAPLHTPSVAIYHHPAKDFILPAESEEKSIIMIGPGTGVAPFRGFLQERIAKNARGENWLFFGERNAAFDFYYKDFWNDLVATQKLHLDLAFSRDAQEKVYVQHKMLEKGSRIWEWIQKGALLYVCGDAEKMAKDVDAALQ